MAAPNLSLSLGAIEVGILISTFLYGVTCVQCYIYSTGTAKPPWPVRLLVPMIWAIETIHTFFMWHWLYRCTVTYYGLSSILLQDHWTISTTAFFDGLVGAAVQIYFAYRIHTLSRKWLITVISWVGSVIAFIATTAIMVISKYTDLVDFENKYRWLVATGLSFLLFVDVVNTVALCVYLRIERTGSSSRIDSILNKMFLWTLETGLITSVAGLLMLVFSLTLPNTSLWISLSTFYAKLYSNSLMASLNGREHLRTSRLPTLNNISCPDEWTYPTLNTVRTEICTDIAPPRREKNRGFGFMFER